MKLIPPRGTDDDGAWCRPVPLGIALDTYKLPFIANTPVAASMSMARPQGKKVSISGDDAYRELLLPLTKAME